VLVCAVKKQLAYSVTYLLRGHICHRQYGMFTLLDTLYVMYINSECRMAITMLLHWVWLYSIHKKIRRWEWKREWT